MIRKFGLCLLPLVFGAVLSFAQTSKNKWIDSVFNALSVSDKVGQLFMVSVSSAADEQELNRIEELIKEDNIGGIIFTSGNVKSQANLINRFQAVAKTPLLIGMDAPKGLGALLDSTITFPSPIIQGAVSNDSAIYAMSKEIGRELKLLGVHLNLSPFANLAIEKDVADVNSFGSNPQRVASKALMFMKGLESENVLACARYYPLSGDSLQVYPFQYLMRYKLKALMPSSSQLPVFVDSVNRKLKDTKVSRLERSQILADSIGFQGLLVMDIANLKATKDFDNGDAEIFAFENGNDLLITSSDADAALRKMKRMLRKEKDYVDQLDLSIKKILAAKYEAGLAKRQAINTDNLLLKLNPPEAKLVQQKLFESAITVSRNRANVLPVKTLDDKKIISLIAGNAEQKNTFYQMMAKYVPSQAKLVGEQTKDADLLKALKNHNVVIASFFPQTSDSLVKKMLNIVGKLNKKQDVIICDFGCEAFKKYAAQYQTVIHAYTDAPEMLRSVPQVIFGGLPSLGVLPFNAGELKEGTGISTIPLNRFRYSIPADAGMDEKTLSKIESIAQEAINNSATPGCYVFVAKDGKVVYQKAFGYLTYEKQTPVTDSTIYDLASVTKVSATLQTTMFMQERGLININKKASTYLPELQQSNKKDFTLKDILTHQAGLWPFLPFWAQTMKDGKHLPEFYSNKPSKEYPLVVADNLFARSTMKDSLWSWIIKSKVREKPSRTPYDYKYSDMGFYILQHLAEKVLNQPIEDFLSQNLYEPLGAYTTGYQPLLRYPISQIAPTENDKLFRKALLIGTVHDQGAAMHGGVAGHAGLFSTANDLAKLGQMLLQEGNYGGTQFYKPETVKLFTQKQFANSRRGLGWDKPILSDHNSPTSLFASPKTFGHTGFTGTCIWVDPEFNLVYVFLSNRVHPDMTNNKLLSGNIRSRIQDVIYQSIFNYNRDTEAQPLVKNQ